MEDEIYRALNYGAAAAELPSAINEMTVAAWDALIAEGRAAIQAAEEQEDDADVAAALMRNKVDELNANLQSIRAIAKAQFKRSNPVVAGQFESTPSYAKAPEDVLSRAVAVNAAWSHHPGHVGADPRPRPGRLRGEDRGGREPGEDRRREGEERELGSGAAPGEVGRDPRHQRRLVRRGEELLPARLTRAHHDRRHRHPPPPVGTRPATAGCVVEPGGPVIYVGRRAGFAAGRSVVAFTPGLANLQVVAGNLYFPMQFGPRDDTGDIFESATGARLPTAVFADDWDHYHRNEGEVHCASATKRQFLKSGDPLWNWWEAQP